MSVCDAIICTSQFVLWLVNSFAGAVRIGYKYGDLAWMLSAFSRNQSLLQRSLLLAFAPTWPLLAAFTFAQSIPRRFWQRPLLNSILAPGYLLAAFAFRCCPGSGHFSQHLPFAVFSHTVARSPLTHSY